MARFNASDLEHYGNSTSKFFTLKNDKEVARVRFMYDNIDDVEGYSVHQVELADGTKRYVSCLREYNEPMDKCPLCAAGYKVIAKLYIPVYDEDAKEAKLWERGKTFYSKISSLCSRYNPLVGSSFEIERNGKPGDTQTKYEIYPVGTDELRLDDLPEIPDPLGSIILVKDFEELEQFLNTGQMGGSAESEDEMPRRRTAAAGNPAPSRAAQPAPSRRGVPSRGGREVF